jgi:hypothetical protein
MILYQIGVVAGIFVVLMGLYIFSEKYAEYRKKQKEKEWQR